VNAEAAGATGAHIEARGLTRLFGDFVALDGLDLEIDRGETFGLLGANGAGKTTFIRLLTGFLLPSAGTVTVDGVSSVDDAATVQMGLGYAPERPRLYPELSVRRYLRFAGGLRQLRGPALGNAVEQALSRFGLESVADRPCGHLSKGFQQRVSLAQAFLHEPPLLIVDEPTSGLDPLQREEVRSVVAEMQGRRTVLLCTHDLAEARALTDRCAVLYQGRLVALGDSDEVLGCDDPLALFRGEAPAMQGGADGTDGTDGMDGTERGA